MSAHSPGPWKVDGEYVSTEDGIPVVVLVWGVNPMKEAAEVTANARLIASAPEILDALKEVLALSDRKHDAWNKARVAIAKAEGRL